jgi:F0F1-type ATP synthase membrane subunit c/vacuolar-type H+-ATPase subunit K
MKNNGYIDTCLMLAKGILHDRSLRRKMMTQLVIFLLFVVAIGSWLIGDWLRDEVVRFVIFWGLVSLYSLFIMMMAFYDMLKVMRGE